MEKELYDKIRLAIIKEIAEHDHIEMAQIEGLGNGQPIRTDIGDIGNIIGIAVGDFIVEQGWNKNQFIMGIEHGISLKDGTHG